MTLKNLTDKMAALANPDQAKILSRFFKTGKGEYGEGDVFLGIKVPIQRQLVKEFNTLPMSDTTKLVKSKIHEHRLTALLIWVSQYERLADDKTREDIFKAYLSSTNHINNWDLVDLTAPNIVGTHLLKRNRTVLYDLARSKNLWERRIAILATHAFIRRADPTDTFAIADLLMNDKEDLIHKSVGWMLREVGKRVSELEEKRYLETRYQTMPRTMLRYAIERFGTSDKLHFMKK